MSLQSRDESGGSTRPRSRASRCRRSRSLARGRGRFVPSDTDQ